MSELRPSRRTIIRGAVLLGAGATVGGAGLTHHLLTADAAVAAPTIHSCGTWGARAARSLTQLSSRPTKILVHHTATGNSSDTSQAHAFALARSIQNFHMDSRGWADTGQHFTISRGGHVMEGRHTSLSHLRNGSGHVVGSHCPGRNSDSIGIENEGLYTSVAPPAALYNQLVTFCAYACQQFRIPASQIFGHRDFSSTACPGNVLYSMLPQLRRDVAARLGSGGGGGTTRNWPVVRSGATGERVRTVQHLLRQHGHSLTADGIFGGGTDTAVRAFQRAKGLTVDGIVGNQTWEKLVVVLRSGASGEAVHAAQRQLNRRSYGLVVDGAFGSRTDAAVRDFQSKQSLAVDGIVGANTWLKLVL